MSTAWAEAVKSALFASTCVACRAGGPAPFCGVCQRELRCAGPFTEPGFYAAAAALVYDGPIVQAVHAMKYQRRPDIGVSLGACLVPLLPLFDPTSIVVPIPSSPERGRARGYNQARELARALPWRITRRALCRPHAARSQVKADRAHRFANLHGAFVAQRESVAGRTVLLLDDVITTGATVGSAKDALLAAGARQVGVLALCRALPT